MSVDPSMRPPRSKDKARSGVLKLTKTQTKTLAFLGVLLVACSVVSLSMVGVLWTRAETLEKRLVTLTATMEAFAKGMNVNVTVNASTSVTGLLNATHGGTGETNYTEGQLLIGNSDGGLTKNTLVGGSNVGITNGNGSITIGLDGPVTVANGGTGESAYTDGELLIGNSAGSTLTKATLTAGAGILITNGPGSVSIGVTGIQSALTAGTNIALIDNNVTVTVGLTGTVAVANGGTGANASYLEGELLIGNSDGGLTKNVLAAGTNVAISNGNGTITIGLSGIVDVGHGGTGEGAFSNGQLLIGNNSGGLTKNTLTAGTNVDIVNGDGSITVGLTGTVAVLNGGTGQNDYLEGELLIGNSDGGLSKNRLTPGTNVDIVNGNGTILVSLTGTIDPTLGGTGQNTYVNGQLLIGNAAGGLSKSTLTPGANIAITNGDGTISIGFTDTVGAGNGGTGQTTYSGGQLLIGNDLGGLSTNTLTPGTNIAVTNGNGTIAVGLTGTVGVTLGGTGQTSYTGGQLLIGNNAGGLTKSTLTAGTNIGVTNGDGTVSVGLTGTVAVSNGGTGQTTYTNGQLLVGNAAGGLTKATLTAGTNVAVTNGDGTVTVGLTGTVAVANGGTGQTSYTNGQLLIGNAGGSLTKGTLTAGTNIGVTNGDGTVTVGLTGTVDVSNGGTGQTTYTSGQLLIGNAVGGLTKNALTAGSNIIITNGNGTITVAFSSPVLASGGGTGQTTYSNGQLLIGNGGGSLTKATLTAGTNIAVTNGNGAITLALTGTVAVTNGGTGQTTYTDGQLLIGNTVGNTLTKATLTAGTNIAVTNGNGAITVGLTGTVAVANGGTGQSTYTNGQLLIGNTVGNTLTKATLTAGTNIAVTNGNGAITVGLTGTVAVANGGTGDTTYTNGQLLIGNTAAGNTLTKATLTAGNGIGITNGGGSITLAAALKSWVFADLKSSGVTGGASTNTFQTRTLNTVSVDGGSDVTLNTTSSAMTFAAGTYHFWARVPGYGVSHQAILRLTSGGTWLFGSSEIAATGTQTISTLASVLTFGSPQILEIRHYTSAVVTDGLGKAYGGGNSELYTQVIIVRLV